MCLVFTLKWRIGFNDEGKLLRDFLKEQGISKRALTDIKFRGGKIFVNELEVTVRTVMKKGDCVKIEFPEERTSEGLKGENIPLSILYEDDYILVINKPPNMNTIPSREHPTGSLANALVGYYERIGLNSTTHIVTRLDRNTSGLVLVAKHRHIHHLLSEQQKKGMVKREYEAIANGVFKKSKDTIEKPIRRKKESIIEREVHPEGQFALTEYEVLHQYATYAHLKLRLKTGRTHQIRVHLSSLGHPLLGDDLYGGSHHLIKRQALHCSRLDFCHPVLHHAMQFEAPLPADMKRLLKEDPD